VWGGVVAVGVSGLVIGWLSVELVVVTKNVSFGFRDAATRLVSGLRVHLDEVRRPLIVGSTRG
jgi:hypothetical protein